MARIEARSLLQPCSVPGNQRQTRIIWELRPADQIRATPSLHSGAFSNPILIPTWVERLRAAHSGRPSEFRRIGETLNLPTQTQQPVRGGFRQHAIGQAAEFGFEI